MTVSQRQYDTMVRLAAGHGTGRRDDPAKDREILLRANRLARRGRYAEAVAMLMALPSDSPLGPSALDLKAKVYAQQGMYAAAEACWRDALALAPGNQAFEDALSVMVEDRRYPFRLRVAVAIMASAITSGVLLLAAFAVLRWRGWIGK